MKNYNKIVSSLLKTVTKLRELAEYNAARASEDSEQIANLNSSLGEFNAERHRSLNTADKIEGLLT